MSRPIITLTTDFGIDSPYVAQMKGAVLEVCRDAVLVDLCHGISPQNIVQGALVLADSTPHFPADTIHVAVVDPGVGTSRRLLAARIADHTFVLPDNGLLTIVADRRPPSQLISLTNASYWKKSVSPTFHGRDVMAPVAAHLAAGLPLNSLGAPSDSWVRLDLPAATFSDQEVRGVCLLVDSFGNLISNIEASLLEPWGAAHCVARVGDRSIQRRVTAYAEAAMGELVWLVGSHGRLEVAQVNGHAARALQAGPGSVIVLRQET
jgi:S-adenosyl-L-methionine hydrolase (adenosine-forming)